MLHFYKPSISIFSVLLRMHTHLLVIKICLSVRLLVFLPVRPSNACNVIQVGLLSQAIRAAVYKLWQKYKCEKHRTILRHWRRQMMISLLYVTYVLNAKLCSIYALISDYLEVWTWFLYLFFGFFLLKKSGLIFFKVQWQHYTPQSALLKLTPRAL